MTPQEELDFQWVVGRLRFLNDLQPPPPQASRIVGPAIEDYVGDQRLPSTSYALPRSRMMESLISDANARLSLDKGCLKELKKTKDLLPAPMKRHRRYYLEQGCADAPATLNDSMADLLKLSTDRVAKKDVSFSATEIKDLDASLGSVCATTSWLDHWLNAFGRSSLDPTRDEASIRRLLQSGSRALFFLARQINTVWINLRLKRRDSALESLVTGCSPEDVAALRNGLVDDSSNLFPEEVMRDVVKNLRSRSETEALRKVAFPEGKKRSSPSRGHGSSGSGRQPKAQKTTTTANAPPASSTAEKPAEQTFPKASGQSRGRRKGKGKKKGGSN